MIDQYILTFDTDWAPDWCIGKIIDVLVENEIKSTWFMTNTSSEIVRMRERPDLFEVGVHPNFLPTSTQGRDIAEVMSNLVRLFPEAVSVRTHGLLQSSNILRTMTEEFGIQNDASILLPYGKGIEPHTLHFSEGRSLTRLPFYWEDDMEMANPERSFSLSDPKYHHKGLKIFNYHIIHLILNSVSFDGYEQLKASRRSLNDLAENDVHPFFHDGEGTYHHFSQLVSMMTGKKMKTFTIADIADEWRDSQAR